MADGKPPVTVNVATVTRVTLTFDESRRGDVAEALRACGFFCVTGIFSEHGREGITTVTAELEAAPDIRELSETLREWLAS